MDQAVENMKAPVRTEILPVAGLGARFLPTTKVTPKELLPVLDRPLIRFAINEARCGDQTDGICQSPAKNHR